MRKFFLVNDFLTFRNLKNNNKIDSKTIIIFLNTTFLNHEDFFFQKKKLFFYDEWITAAQQKKIGLFLDSFLFKWNIKNTSEDLSQLDGFSIGNNFNDSIRIFAINFLKKYYSFSNILKKNDIVYLYSKNSQLINILNELKKKINFNFFLENSNNFEADENQGIREASKIMKTYINIFFSNNFFTKFKSIIFALAIFFLKKILIKSSPGCVLMLRSGKTEEFKRFLFLKKNLTKISWGINLNSQVNLNEVFRTDKKLFFFLRSVIIKKDNKLNIKITKLFNYLKTKNIKYMPCKKIFLESFIQSFKNQFYASYYQYLSDYSDLKKIKPKLCIITADNYPDHLIFAQAAKNLKIKTAFYPHGMTGAGETQLRVGKNSVFDYFFAFGNFDYSQYLKNGIKKEKIFITNHQYFENFLFVKKKKKKFNKCFILDQDEVNDDPFFKIKHIYLTRNIALAAIKKLGIKVIGIKSRMENCSPDYVKKINYKRENIFIYYSQDLLLINSFDKVDFLIGCPGTALLESSLSQTPFYSLISKQNKHNQKWLTNYLKNYFFLAQNTKELIMNLKNKNIFKKQRSINDFVNLKNIKSSQALYNIIENKICDIRYD